MGKTAKGLRAAEANIKTERALLVHDNLVGRESRNDDEKTMRRVERQASKVVMGSANSRAMGCNLSYARKKEKGRLRVRLRVYVVRRGLGKSHRVILPF
ncbi:hypothetical protein PanWU01x14_119420 [Parasponia andersonii]|uniref:Uncharacterized protein n=1 Tax=Parasponia andersonii TaxID=3476 RepID=A0A2P5CVF5_PARAD|nr:hypothetical protein PanWU01x14_119420 [Parasponia andersonii]